MTSTQERSVPKVQFTDAEAGAKEFPDSTSRSYNYYAPQKRKQSHYEDMTVEVQPDPRHYLSQGWLYGFADGKGGYPLEWTALKAWGSDRPEPERGPGSGGKGYPWPALGWHEFRDPNEEWELTLYRYNANVVRQLNQNIEAARQAKAKACRKVIPLPVSVPVHTSLMQAAAARLAVDVDRMPMQDLTVPLINNAEAKPIRTAADVRTSLVRQLSRPVLWEESVQALVKMGIHTLVEVGPGRVLSGLAKRIAPELRLFNVQDRTSLAATVEALAAARP